MSFFKMKISCSAKLNRLGRLIIVKKTLMLMLTLILVLSLLVACSVNKLDSTTDIPESKSSDFSNEYKKGTLTETEFESEYLDLRFTPPEGFILLTEDEMYAALGLGAEIVDLDPDLLEYAINTGIYEMMAVEATGKTSVFLFADKPMIIDITVEQHFEGLKYQLKRLTAAGIEYEIEDEIVSVEIAGQSYKQFTVSMLEHGENTVQKYFLRKVGNRIGGFVVSNTADTEEFVDALMAGFTKF